MRGEYQLYNPTEEVYITAIDRLEQKRFDPIVIILPQDKNPENYEAAEKLLREINVIFTFLQKYNNKDQKWDSLDRQRTFQEIKSIFDKDNLKPLEKELFGKLAKIILIDQILFKGIKDNVGDITGMFGLIPNYNKQSVARKMLLESYKILEIEDLQTLLSCFPTRDAKEILEINLTIRKKIESAEAIKDALGLFDEIAQNPNIDEDDERLNLLKKKANTENETIYFATLVCNEEVAKKIYETLLHSYIEKNNDIEYHIFQCLKSLAQALPKNVAFEAIEAITKAKKDNEDCEILKEIRRHIEHDSGINNNDLSKIAIIAEQLKMLFDLVVYYNRANDDMNYIRREIWEILECIEDIFNGSTEDRTRRNNSYTYIWQNTLDIAALKENIGEVANSARLWESKLFEVINSITEGEKEFYNNIKKLFKELIYNIECIGSENLSQIKEEGQSENIATISNNNKERQFKPKSAEEMAIIAMQKLEKKEFEPIIIAPEADCEAAEELLARINPIFAALEQYNNSSKIAVEWTDKGKKKIFTEIVNAFNTQDLALSEKELFRRFAEIILKNPPLRNDISRIVDDPNDYYSNNAIERIFELVANYNKESVAEAILTSDHPPLTFYIFAQLACYLPITKVRKIVERNASLKDMILSDTIANALIEDIQGEIDIYGFVIDDSKKLSIYIATWIFDEKMLEGIFKQFAVYFLDKDIKPEKYTYEYLELLLQVVPRDVADKIITTVAEDSKKKYDKGLKNLKEIQDHESAELCLYATVGDELRKIAVIAKQLEAIFDLTNHIKKNEATIGIRKEIAEIKKIIEDILDDHLKRESSDVRGTLEEMKSKKITEEKVANLIERWKSVLDEVRNEEAGERESYESFEYGIEKLFNALRDNIKGIDSKNLSQIKEEGQSKEAVTEDEVYKLSPHLSEIDAERILDSKEEDSSTIRKKIDAVLPVTDMLRFFDTMNKIYNGFYNPFFYPDLPNSENETVYLAALYDEKISSRVYEMLLRCIASIDDEKYITQIRQYLLSLSQALPKDIVHEIINKAIKLIERRERDNKTIIDNRLSAFETILPLGRVKNELNSMIDVIARLREIFNLISKYRKADVDLQKVILRLVEMANSINTIFFSSEDDIDQDPRERIEAQRKFLDKITSDNGIQSFKKIYDKKNSEQELSLGDFLQPEMGALLDDLLRQEMGTLLEKLQEIANYLKDEFSLPENLEEEELNPQNTANSDKKKERVEEQPSYDPTLPLKVAGSAITEVKEMLPPRREQTSDRWRF